MQPSSMSRRAEINSNPIDDVGLTYRQRALSLESAGQGRVHTLMPSDSVEFREFTKDVEHFDIQTEMNSMFDVEKAVEKNAIKKAHTAVLKIWILGLLSGWWVGLCAIMSQMVRETLKYLNYAWLDLA
jgi:hypothetical protein